MTEEALAQANALVARIAQLEKLYDQLEDEKTLFLYETAETHREDACDFPDDLMPNLRACAVRQVREKLADLRKEFAKL